MLTKFEKTVADFIADLGPFSKAKKILLAVSGGADSTALLYSLYVLKRQGVLQADLVCAHINHQLRIPDADVDEEFVVSQAKKLGIAVISRKIDVRKFSQENKFSIETAARILRIRQLQDIAESNGCDWVATAHQKNDNAETVIQRLLRGTGFRGLAGIWPMRNFGESVTFVRPLLCVTRDQIVEYLKGRNLQWRTDRTNYDCRYKRNFLRHKLLPHIQKSCANSLFGTLYELSVSAQRFQSKVDKLTGEVWPRVAVISEKTIALDLQTFLNQPQPVQVELIGKSLTYLGCGQGNLTQEHFEEIIAAAKENISGRKVTLPGGYRIWREYENLIFAASQNRMPPVQIPEVVTLEVPGRTVFGNYSIESSVLTFNKTGFEEFRANKTPFVEWFDFDRLQLPLIVRMRRVGDKFIPLGLESPKKIGKFLTLAKVPNRARQNTLIVADAQKIIWVCPIRISEQTKVSGQTSRILQLQISGS